MGEQERVMVMVLFSGFSLILTSVLPLEEASWLLHGRPSCICCCSSTVLA